jgi:hypothetical protein
MTTDSKNDKTMAALPSAMTAQTELDRYVNALKENFYRALDDDTDELSKENRHDNNDAPRQRQQQRLSSLLEADLMASVSDALTQWGGVVSDAEFAAFLAQHDRRFRSAGAGGQSYQQQRPLVVGHADLHDANGAKTVVEFRAIGRDLAQAVRSAHDAALARSAEILHYELRATLPTMQMLQHQPYVNDKATTTGTKNAAEGEKEEGEGSNETTAVEELLADAEKEEADDQLIPENLQTALRDMAVAVATAKLHLDEYEPVPQHIRFLDEQLRTVRQGLHMLTAPSQTQDAIDKVMDGWQKERRQQMQAEGEYGNGETSPTELWATVLRPNIWE